MTCEETKCEIVKLSANLYDTQHFSCRVKEIIHPRPPRPLYKKLNQAPPIHCSDHNLRKYFIMLNFKLNKIQMEFP
jgi:hypothetical protein